MKTLAKDRLKVQRKAISQKVRTQCETLQADKTNFKNYKKNKHYIIVSKNLL
jgi:hypothetical protein